MRAICLAFLLTLTSMVSCSETKRVADLMYISFDRARYCVRRLNGTHEIGCQSAMNGNSGRMYMIDNAQEFDEYLLDSQTIDSYHAFILLINADLFDSMHMDRLMNRLETKLNGIVFYITSNSTRPKDFSHDDQCPNRRQSYYLNQTSVNWNSQGTGLFFRSFPFPMMFIDEQDDYQRLVEFYRKFPTTSTSAPVCGLELKVFQSAAHTSKTCMRRNDISHSLIDPPETFCDPVGGLNIYSKLPQSIKIQPQERPLKSVILILTRTDSFQMFLKTKGGTGGAQQPAVALITFLALAHLIGQEQTLFNNQNKEIIFVTLDGDALDYSASFKFMFDMTNSFFPAGNNKEQRINVEHIHSVIELQSLGMTEKIWVSPISSQLVKY
jgi:nicastrin